MITEDEIEKAADSFHAECLSKCVTDPEKVWYPTGAWDGFQAGARWALAHVTALEWKRPEEELPTLENDNVYVYTAMGAWPAYFSHIDNAWCFAAPRPGPNPLDWSTVIAWACIPLPEWLGEQK